MDEYQKGMIIKMKVFNAPLREGPGYTAVMLLQFKENPYVEVLWEDHNRLCVKDSNKTVRHILKERVDKKESVLFI